MHTCMYEFMYLTLVYGDGPCQFERELSASDNVPTSHPHTPLLRCHGNLQTRCKHNHWIPCSTCMQGLCALASKLEIW